jgi:hypothetical protein
MCRRSCHRVVGLFLLLTACTSGPGSQQAADPPPPTSVMPEDGKVLVVAEDGDDEAVGRRTDPFATLRRGFEALQPGDTLLVRGGRYREDLRDIVIKPATRARPILVRAWPGEEPILEGHLTLRRPSHWTVDGLDVSWSGGDRTQHMVTVIDGTGWQLLNSELAGAQSFANLLVYGSGEHEGEPGSWRVAGNCIHTTVPSNGRNQDHNLYVNTGSGAGPGLVERNLLFDAPNGMNIKLGGSAEDEGAAVHVTVRRNTMVDAAQNVMIAWRSRGNVIQGNLLSGAQNGYGNIRGFQLSNDTNVAHDNLGHDAASLFLHHDSEESIQDAGGNVFGLDPEFDTTGRCDGFRPTAPGAAGYGHLAPDEAGEASGARDPAAVTARYAGPL